MLTHLLTGRMNRIVVDETGLNGVYDFELAYQPGDAAVMANSLARLGFQLERGRREVRMLVVDAAKP